MRKVWHEGERRMHRALDVEARMRERGAIVVRDAMPDQHRDFFRDMHFVVLSALDTKGQPWPFIRGGQQGFMNSPAATKLIIVSHPLSAEPADLRLGVGDKISVLGIELETRRRNRMNGTIDQIDGDAMTISVDQSFGNCPRYIHERDRVEIAKDCGDQSAISTATSLSTPDAALISQADTLFIASRAPKVGLDRGAGVDVNHRGGLAGFIKVIDENTVVFPDYDGNKFFNTFGNILLDSRVGVMIPEFDTGTVLTLSGTAEIILDTAENAADYGAERATLIKVDKVVRATDALPVRYALNRISQDPPSPGTL
ncbi:MAG: pyridoxamine 5'-phosphate oxidase family protein [Litoreibacter sp.]